MVRSLDEAPAVVILGPRQIGKTTLAQQIADTVPGSAYLDLEDPAQAARLVDPARYLAHHAGALTVLDEVQRMPGLFDVLRGQIDLRRRAGRRTRHFLLLGSASRALLNQSAESLAGRLVCYELPGLDAQEVGAGPSWEGFAIENLLAVAPFGTDAWFYRTRAGAEIDLLLLLPDQRLWAVEVKRGAVRKTSKGFELAATDLGVAERFVVHSGDVAYPLSEHTTAMPLDALMTRLANVE